MWLFRVRTAIGAIGAVGAAGAGYTMFPQHATPSEAKKSKHSIVVVGGGAAGLTVASQLLRKLGGKAADLAIIEPSEVHYYQPGWTLVGAGIMAAENTRRPMSSVMPKDATWIQASVKSFDPDHNAVELSDGRRLSYDHLVVAVGLSVDFASIKGLAEAVGHDGVSSIYHFAHAQAAWRDIKALKQGVAIFTQPKCGIKCGGAPQKIMWLAEDWWRNTALVRPAVTVNFVSGCAKLFAVDKYRASLEKIREARRVDVDLEHELVEVDGKRRTAVFQRPDGSLVRKPYDLLHVVPRMGPPDFLRTSKLADAAGFVAADKATLQHPTYKNVFSLGDCAGLPTSKTAAAVTAQAPVLVHNLVRLLTTGEVGRARYDGYTSCPILTRRGGLILAEFKYGGELAETFNYPPLLDQAKESYLFYLMKCVVFPAAYWHLMLQGRWFGTRTIFEPKFED